MGDWGQCSQCRRCWDVGDIPEFWEVLPQHLPPVTEEMAADGDDATSYPHPSWTWHTSPLPAQVRQPSLEPHQAWLPHSYWRGLPKFQEEPRWPSKCLWNPTLSRGAQVHSRLCLQLLHPPHPANLPFTCANSGYCSTSPGCLTSARPFHVCPGWRRKGNSPGTAVDRPVPAQLTGW